MAFVIILICGFCDFSRFVGAPECESGTWAWIVLWAAEGAVVGHLVARNCEYLISLQEIVNIKSLCKKLSIFNLFAKICEYVICLKQIVSISHLYYWVNFEYFTSKFVGKL